MSQIETLIILEEMGGKGRTFQVAAAALRKYPEFSLNTYVSDRLAKAKKWGYVTKEGNYWILTDQGKKFIAPYKR